MLTLILMRHAKSSWDTPTLEDQDRPLNKRGQRGATAMGDWLRRIDVLPDQTLSSSARRTMETFEHLRLETPIAFSQTLYHAGAEVMHAALRTAQPPCILMLGHNPGIAEFAERLLATPPDHPRFHDYPTCATLIATFDAPDWSQIGWGAGIAARFATPHDMPPNQT